MFMSLEWKLLVFEMMIKIKKICGNENLAMSFQF